MEWIDEANKENDFQSEIMSFQDYMEVFRTKPKRECRPTSKYFIDMLHHFGQDEKGKIKLFEIDHHDCPAVFGQTRPEERVIQALSDFMEEGINNKFILLVGPNGSSKSSIVKKFMKGAELYSETEEGALFTFSWIFPIDNFVKGSLGLGASSKNTELNSFAHLEDKDISAILPSELKDHPLLLIPQKHRRNLLKDIFADDPDYIEFLEKTYFFKGDLSKRNRMIYEALLKNYKGDHGEVLKHIRIERFTISRRYSVGAITIEPQLHVDAQIQQITMDKRLQSLPPSLQSLNLFSLRGEAIMANRGIIEYSDILKRPLDTYKYLLMTMETSNININGILTELDTFFIGTSNEIHLAGFKQHPDFNSFKGRFTFIKVPYLLDYKQEENIYKNQVDGLKEKSFFEPHTLSALCIFSVMTRIRPCQSKNYADKKMSEIVSTLNPLQKVLFLSEGTLPNHLDSESQQILKMGLDEIKSEYENENLYEGKFGLSPRDIKNIIYRLASRYKNVTFIEFFEYLDKLIQKKNEYDFLNMTPQGDYHHPSRFVSLLKSYFLNIFDEELRDSLGLVDDRSYEDYLKKYIAQISALIKGEKVKSSITGKYEECDQYFINEFENNIKLTEGANKFRSHLISKLGAFALDNPNKGLIYTEVFPEIVKLLQESFRNEQKKVISEISKNFVFFEAEFSQTKEGKSHQTPLSEKDRQQIFSILERIEKKHGYTRIGALSLIKFVIKEIY